MNQIFIALCPNCRYPKVYDNLSEYRRNAKNGIAFAVCHLKACRSAVSRNAPRSNKAVEIVKTKEIRDLSKFVAEYKKETNFSAGSLQSYKGWAIKTEIAPIVGKRFIAENGSESRMALTLKRLKLKIDAYLLMPQILDKESNFV